MRVDTYLYSYGEDGSMSIDCKVWNSYQEAMSYIDTHRKPGQCAVAASTPEQQKRAMQLMGWEVKE